METSKTVTTQSKLPARRSLLDLQPLPKHHGANGRQDREIALGDAELAVMWLNAAKEAETTVSYDAVMSIRSELEEMRTLLDTVQQTHALIDWQRVADAKGKEKKRLESETHAHAARYTALWGKADQRMNALNKVLSGYVFRPNVTYFQATNAWIAGMMSDVSVNVNVALDEYRTGFLLKIPDYRQDRHISEGDAVMALVRLASTRELGKIHLCEKCNDRWHVAKRSIDRFCSAECREAFYVKSAQYKDRKAANQRRYREQLKKNGRA